MRPLWLQLPPSGTVSSALASMFRSTRLPSLVLAIACSGGCFTDQSGEPGSDDTSDTGASGTTGGSTGQISASFTTDGPPTTIDTIDTIDTISATTEGDATGASTTQDPDTTATTDPTDAESSGSSSDSGSTSSSTGDGTLSVADLEPGDLVITEVMGNPNCNADSCEWFELYNATAFPIDLFLLGIGDEDDFDLGMPGAIIGESAILEPGALGIIARQELWPYTAVDEPLARYPNTVQLSNSSFDGITIFGADDVVLDHTAVFFGNDQPGRSRVLLLEFWDGDHENSSNWCWSDTPLPAMPTSDDWGSPGTDVVECFVE